MSGAEESADALALADGRKGGGRGREEAGASAAAARVAPQEPRDGGECGGRGEHGEGALRHCRLSWSEARAAAAAEARPPEAAALPLDRALGRLLAAPLEALTDLPSFDTSAMDGWAVSGPGPWELAGTAAPGSAGILAGHPAAEPLPDGGAVPIATGARVPPGATAVLRSERGEVRGRRLHAREAPPPGADIRPRGQECRRGDRLLPSGIRVTPAVLGLAAAAGYDELPVVRRLRAEVLVLGDELLAAGRPRDGRVRDALGPMVGPWLAAMDADVAGTRRLGDDAETLCAALADTTADLVVTTGGTASGPVDHVHPALRRLGATLLVDGVAVRPGHPMLLARLPSGTRLVGLPGNPLAAVSGLLTLAGPLLRPAAPVGSGTDGELEHPEAPAPGTAALLTADVQGHPRDTRLVPVVEDGGCARPLRFAGPAMLRGIAGATALAVVPPGGGAAGTDVRLLRLPWA